MKRTIICLVITAVLGACFATNAVAAPEIIGVRGGYSVIAMSPVQKISIGK